MNELSLNLQDALNKAYDLLEEANAILLSDGYTAVPERIGDFLEEIDDLVNR